MKAAAYILASVLGVILGYRGIEWLIGWWTKPWWGSP